MFFAHQLLSTSFKSFHLAKAGTSNVKRAIRSLQLTRKNAVEGLVYGLWSWIPLEGQFVLTVAKVIWLILFFRLARLDVNARQWKSDQTAEPLDIRGMNVRRIEIKSLQSYQHFQTYVKCRPYGFSPVNNSVLGPLAAPRAYGPMIRILSSPASFLLVIPSSKEDQSQHLSIAKRIAHDLYVYHKADCEIIPDHEGLERVAKGQIGPGSIIIIGRPENNRYTEWMAAERKIPSER